MQEVKRKKVKRLTSVELAKVKDVFSLYGTKQDFHGKYGHAIPTIYNIIKRGYGMDYIVEALIKYAEEERGEG